MLSQVKKLSSESGVKYAQMKHSLQVKTALNKMLVDFDVRGQQGRNFSTGGSIMIDNGQK